LKEHDPPAMIKVLNARNLCHDNTFQTKTDQKLKKKGRSNLMLTIVELASQVLRPQRFADPPEVINIRENTG
jgi:hypothetical protein